MWGNDTLLLIEGAPNTHKDVFKLLWERLTKGVWANDYSHILAISSWKLKNVGQSQGSLGRRILRDRGK